MNELIIVLIVTSTISVLASSSVLLTMLVFPQMRSKTFMRVIAYVSFGDIFGNIPYLFPFRPATGNAWCSAQAFMSLTGYPTSWCWTVALVYLLFWLGAVGRMPSLLHLHVICWSLPIIISLTTLAYSKYYGPHGVDVCSTNMTDLAVGAHIAVYYGVLFFSIVIIVSLLYRLYQLQQRKDPNVSSAVFQRAKNTLLLYPAAMVIFWFPHLFTEILLIFGFNKYREVLLIYYIFIVLKVLYGLAAAIIFFSRSNEARLLWWMLVRQWLYGNEIGSKFNDPGDSHDIYDDHDADAIIRERMKEFSASRGSEVQMSFNAILFPDSGSRVVSVNTLSPPYSRDTVSGISVGSP
jgi:hypothetical protein